MDRCTGHCCQKIRLPFSPFDLALFQTGEIEDRANLQDIGCIADMLIVTGKDPNFAEGGQEFWEYSCRHFDAESKLCRIYEKRPMMCRNHGEKYPCDIQGCTWKQAKREPERYGG